MFEVATKFNIVLNNQNDTNKHHDMGLAGLVKLKHKNLI